MIVLFMILLSLSAIYFIRLLSAKRMRVASAMVAALYIYIIIWTYLVFIIDVADLGFAGAETTLSLLHGSGIYHSFVQLTSIMDAIPLPFLESIVFVAALVFVASLTVIIHGAVEITKAIYRKVHGPIKVFGKPYVFRLLKPTHTGYEASILKLHCRANC